MSEQQIVTLIIFILTYAGVATGHIYWLRLDRTGIVLLGAIALMALNCITLEQAVESVNYSSILMLFGLFVISAQLRLSGFYHKVAELVSATMDHPARFLLILMVTTGVLSAFLNNDIVCFAFTPIITVSLLKRKLNPVPFLVALALSSNIGCAATLIGNAQDILVGQMAHLGFGEYMFWALPPVVLSMAAAYGIVWGLGRKHMHLKEEPIIKKGKEDDTPYDAWQSTKGLVVIGIVVVLFFTDIPRHVTAIGAAGILLISHRLKSKKMLKLVDWQLLTLFISLFVVVGAFHKSGLAEGTINQLDQMGVNLQNTYQLSLTTAVLSNLINNSAAVMLLVHMVDLSNHVLGYLLALSNTFAGNLLLIGSVANIIVVRSAKSFGVKISFGAFARYGVPAAISSFVILLLYVYIRT